jgi:hypothetical protein
MGPTKKLIGGPIFIVGLGNAKVGLPPDANRLIGGRVDRLLLVRSRGVLGRETAGVWGTDGGIAGFLDEYSEPIELKRCLKRVSM